MKVAGNHTIAAPRQRVWDALQDPAVLARTLPGCESLEVTAPDCYAATVTAGVASVKGTYQGRVSLSEKDAPSSFCLRAEGAGAPGTIRADATIRLEEIDGSSTRVSYDADAVVGGMIGGVGQRMITGVARKTAGEFFAAVERDLLGAPAPASAAPAAAAGAAAEPVAAAPAVGQVFQGTPATASAGPRPEQLAAFGLGALVALLGVLLGRRTRP